MPVANTTFDAAMVEAALFRSSGVGLQNYAFGPATNPDPAAGFRKYTNKGTGVGHTYLHVEGPSDEGGVAGPIKKSRFQDRQTLIGVLVEALATSQGKTALAELDKNPGSQQWVKGIPVTGPWYGYDMKSTDRRKVLTTAINIRSHGDALFISSAYPDSLQASL